MVDRAYSSLLTHGRAPPVKAVKSRRIGFPPANWTADVRILRSGSIRKSHKDVVSGEFEPIGVFVHHGFHVILASMLMNARGENRSAAGLLTLKFFMVTALSACSSSFSRDPPDSEAIRRPIASFRFDWEAAGLQHEGARGSRSGFSRDRRPKTQAISRRREISRTKAQIQSQARAN